MHMWYLLEPDSVAWTAPFSNTAVQWDTKTATNGPKVLECATESTLRGAYAADIVVEVKN